MAENNCNKAGRVKTVTEFERLVKNINRQLQRLEQAGYEKLSEGYKQVKFASQVISGLKTQGGKVRISSKKSLDTPENVKILQGLAKRLSKKKITEKIYNLAKERGISKEQAKQELRSEQIFANMVETLSSFYDSKQVSQMLQEYDSTPDYEDWLTDILNEEGQLLHDRSPYEFQQLVQTWADMNGYNDWSMQELYDFLGIDENE